MGKSSESSEYLFPQIPYTKGLNCKVNGYNGMWRWVQLCDKILKRSLINSVHSAVTSSPLRALNECNQVKIITGSQERAISPTVIIWLPKAPEWKPTTNITESLKRALEIRNKQITSSKTILGLNYIGKRTDHNYSIVVINAVFWFKLLPFVKTMRIKGKLLCSPIGLPKE